MHFYIHPKPWNLRPHLQQRFCFGKVLVFIKSYIHKKAYFQGVSITGKDWILVMFMLQSLITFKTVAKLPLLWSVINRKEALLISSSGSTLFCFLRIINRVELFTMVWILSAIISNPYNSAAILGAIAAILDNWPSCILLLSPLYQHFPPILFVDEP